MGASVVNGATNLLIFRGRALAKTPCLKLAELARAADHTSVRREPQSLKRTGDVVSSRSAAQAAPPAGRAVAIGLLAKPAA